MGSTYVNPDSLLVPLSVVFPLGLQLRGDKRQHFFSPTEENPASDIISPCLLLVEALEGILLRALGAALVRFDEGGPEEEEEGFEQAESLYLLPVRLGCKTSDIDTGDDGYCYSSIEGLSVSAQGQQVRNVTTLDTWSA